MNHVSWTSILIGLALFLFGIDYLSLSLQELSPTRLKNLLAKCTSSTFKAILIGCFITCIIQSSSATTALTVSLINANLLTFSQSIGIIMGANIGTTITAFIVGFDLFQYASFFLIIGAFCLLFSNHPKIKGLAQILFGLGCLFYGLELMSMHLEAITKLPEFMKLVTLFTNHPILAMFGGAITTALIQSSSAMIAIVQQMYHLKAISLYVSIPYIFGCNIGTTITAFLSALKTNPSAKKAALFHFLFNVIGTTFFMIFLTPFYHLFLTFRFYIPISPRLQLAFIHGFFNIVTTLLIFPCYKHIITLIESCFKKNC